jgi:hypothetical protein
MEQNHHPLLWIVAGLLILLILRGKPAHKTRKAGTRKAGTRRPGAPTTTPDAPEAAPTTCRNTCA